MLGVVEPGTGKPPDTSPVRPTGADEDGHYRIGLRLWEIATVAPLSLTIRDAALPHLADLHRTTRQTVQLSVLNGRDGHP